MLELVTFCKQTEEYQVVRNDNSEKEKEHFYSYKIEKASVYLTDGILLFFILILSLSVGFIYIQGRTFSEKNSSTFQLV